MKSGKKWISSSALAMIAMPLALCTVVLEPVGAAEPVLPPAVVSGRADGFSPANLLASTAQAATLPAAVAAAPVALASANPGGKDPVYEAWEEFLKQRSDVAAAGGGAAVVPAAAEPRLAQGGIQQGSLGGGPWGNLVATVFGGVGLAGAYLARKRAPDLAGWLRTRTGGRKDRKSVRVVSVNPLSSQGSIAVVEVFDEVLVLGVTSGRVSLLTRLNQNGAPAPVEPEHEELDEVMGMPSRGAQRATGGRAQTAQDFNALLGNLFQGGEPPSDGASPLARYAAMGALRKDANFEPPPEDMAGQVLRKMKTMKRFRNSA